MAYGWVSNKYFSMCTLHLILIYIHGSVNRYFCMEMEVEKKKKGLGSRLISLLKQIVWV